MVVQNEWRVEYGRNYNDNGNIFFADVRFFVYLLWQRSFFGRQKRTICFLENDRVVLGGYCVYDVVIVDLLRVKDFLHRDRKNLGIIADKDFLPCSQERFASDNYIHHRHI